MLGVFDIEVAVLIYYTADPTEEVGTRSLCDTLYCINIADGHLLFAEVYQHNPMLNINVVEGNTLTADDMITNMNKNMAARMTHFLPTMGIGNTFVKELVKASIDSTFIF